MNDTGGNAAPHPLTVADLFLKYLAVEDVHELFGIPGVALGPLLDALQKQQQQFTYVLCRQETGAGYIADGYSRVSRRVGVVVVCTGPGATNALTAAVTAQTGCSSLLVLNAEVPQGYYGMAALQQGIDGALDVGQAFRAGVQSSATASTAKNFQTLLATALRTAMSRPRRAAHLNLPEDVAALPVSPSAVIPTGPSSYRTVPVCSNRDQARQAIEAIAGAKRPLLMFGNGTRAALTGSESLEGAERAAVEQRGQALLRMVERLGVPFFTTSDAKGVLPESHPLSLGSYGLGTSVWPNAYMTQELPEPPYDALLVLGSSLGQNATSPTLADGSVTLYDPALIPRGPFLQVDLDQSIIGRSFPLTLGIVAELSVFLDEIIEIGLQLPVDAPGKEQREELVAHIKDTVHLPAPDLQGRMLQAISEELRALGRPSHLFIDACTACQQALAYMVVDPPVQVHSTLSMAPMGWGIGAAIRAKFAAPELPCVAVTGDGCFLMHGSEISTAWRHRKGPILVVFENDTLGTVAQKMKSQYGALGWDRLYGLGAPRLVMLAQGFGAHAVQVESVEALRAAFRQALLDADATPQVIIAVTPLPAPPAIEEGT